MALSHIAIEGNTRVGKKGTDEAVNDFMHGGVVMRSVRVVELVSKQEVEMMVKVLAKKEESRNMQQNGLPRLKLTQWVPQKKAKLASRLDKAKEIAQKKDEACELKQMRRKDINTWLMSPKAKAISYN